MYSFQLTKKFIGIDIGTYSLKIAECQRAGDKVALLNYGIFKLPQDPISDQPLSRQELSASIRESLQKMGIKTSDTVAEVTGPWAVARHLTIPDLPDDEIREAIRWGSRSDFPFALEDAIIDFYKLGILKEEDGVVEAELITAVATQEVVEEQIALLKEAGLKPLFLSVPAFSLMQAYRVTQPAPWSETVAIIDLGNKSTQIIVLKEGKLKFSREIAVAGDTFTQSLTGDYEINGEREEVDEEIAERIKIKIGLLMEDGADPLVEGVPLDQVQKRLASVKDRLLLEIERSISYYKNQFKDFNLDRVLLTGGGSLLKGLLETMEKTLDLPVHFFQTAGSLTLKKKINADLLLRDMPFLTTLLGLVTQTQPFINLNFQFTVPQAKKFSFDKLLKPALVSVVPLGVILFFGSQYWTASQQVTRLKKELTAKSEQMTRMGKPGEELIRLEKEEAQLNNELEGFPKIEIKKLPLSNLFEELSRLVPPRMTLTRFEFSRSQETRVRPEPAAVNPKPEGSEVKTPEIRAAGGIEKGKKEYHFLIQGLIFGSDQEIIATLSEFTRELNRSSFFKEARVQTTLKVTEYSKRAAEFKILAKFREGGISS